MTDVCPSSGGQSSINTASPYDVTDDVDDDDDVDMTSVDSDGDEYLDIVGTDDDDDDDDDHGVNSTELAHPGQYSGVTGSVPAEVSAAVHHQGGLRQPQVISVMRGGGGGCHVFMDRYVVL